MAEPANRAEVYYRWTDGEGRLHIVSSLEAVPLAARPQVERLELGAPHPPSATEGTPAVSASSASLSTIIDDTKRAVEKLNLSQKQRDQELRRIQSEAH